MRPAALRQPLARGLQHDPLRYRDFPQHIEVVASQEAGVEVRQQPGFLEHQPGHLGEVGEGGFVAERRKLLARRAVAQFRLVAECEQCLMAARIGAGTGNGQNLVAVEINAFALPRRLGEGAVVADVAAELGQRNEDLARVRHQPAMTGIA